MKRPAVVEKALAQLTTEAREAAIRAANDMIGNQTSTYWDCHPDRVAAVWAAAIDATGKIESTAPEPEKPEKRARAGSELSLPDVDRWETPVDGAALLDEISATLRRFVVMSPEAADGVSLWTVHAHGIQAADYSPILTISSPVKGCGKTTLQQRLLRRLVPRAVPSCNMSAASLFRLIEATSGTVLFDEFDSLNPEAKEALRNLINAGVGRDDAYVYRVDGDKKRELRRFAVFGPKSIALNGRLPETLEDRSIVVRLERKTKEEHVERLRRRRADEVLTPLQRKAARWTQDHHEEIRETEPEIPSSLNDRAADLWEPLLAIADVAGGEWPGRARRAALFLSSGSPEERGLKEQLISDSVGVFHAKEATRLSSAELVSGLVEMEGRPWAEWYKGRPMTTNGLAKQLKGFGIRPKSIREGEKVVRGYELADFSNAVSRYGSCSGSSDGFEASASQCSGVADEIPPTGLGDVFPEEVEP